MVFKTFIIVALIAFARAQDGEVPPQTPDPTDVPPTPVQCSAAMDLMFVVDSSSSIGQDNFQIIREFLSALVQDVDVAKNLARVAIARYNSWADTRIFFNTNYDKEGVLNAITDMNYYGRGTKTANALNVVKSHHLQRHRGWREGQVPTVVIVLTDGPSQDAADLDKYAAMLRANATRVIAIGVGKAVDSELVQIATQPSSENVIIVNDFFDLLAEIDAIVDRICEVVDDVNECLTDNAGCDQLCINTYNSFYCECMTGYTLASNTTCNDVNECNNDNGGCSDTCVNSAGSYSCSCPPGKVTAGDSKTCVDGSLKTPIPIVDE